MTYYEEMHTYLERSHAFPNQIQIESYWKLDCYYMKSYVQVAKHETEIQTCLLSSIKMIFFIILVSIDHVSISLYKFLKADIILLNCPHFTIEENRGLHHSTKFPR